MKTFEDCIMETCLNRGQSEGVAHCFTTYIPEFEYSIFEEAAILYASYKEESAFQAGYNRGYEERGKIVTTKF